MVKKSKMTPVSGADLHRVRAYVCQHVYDKSRPVLLVSRADGDWQLVCGAGDHDEGPTIMGLSHLTDADPTLGEILNLPRDFEAERTVVGGGWQRRRPND